MAISKIGSNAVDTLSSKLNLTAADGVEDNDYIMELTNAEATDYEVTVGGGASDNCTGMLLAEVREVAA